MKAFVYVIFVHKAGHPRAGVRRPIYIGMGRGKSPSVRWRAHKDAARGKHPDRQQTPLHKCMATWGVRYFTWELYARCSSVEEAQTLEASMIKKHATLIDDADGGVNVSTGGTASPMSTAYGRMLRRTTGTKPNKAYNHWGDVPPYTHYRGYVAHIAAEKAENQALRVLRGLATQEGMSHAPAGCPYAPA
jgi:hypothetical protein